MSNEKAMFKLGHSGMRGQSSFPWVFGYFPSEADQPLAGGTSVFRPSRRWLYRVFVLVLLGTVACTTSDTLASGAAPGRPAGSKWEIGAPITSYYQGPGAGEHFGLMTPAIARKMADGGFNLVWCQTVEELDAAHAQGLRALFFPLSLGFGDPKGIYYILDDPHQRARLDAVIEQVKDHPAMYGYYIHDERSAAVFPLLGRIVAYIRERDPDHMCLVNLFPTYASANSLGIPIDYYGPISDEQRALDALAGVGYSIDAYREHLRQFVEIVKPDLISYDHYHFLGKLAREVGSQRFVTDSQLRQGDNVQYFLNLALVREAAVKSGLPFVNVVQACALDDEGYGDWRIPNGDEGRFLAYTTLAYGGQGLSQFVYYARVPPFRGGVSNFYVFDDSLTPLGEALRQINPEFIAIGTEVQPLTSMGAYHLGTVPFGAVGLPADARFTVDPPVPPAKFDPPAPVTGMLLGYFGTAGNTTHVLVVNLDYTQQVTTTVVGPGSMEVFDATERKWHKASDGSRARVSLMPGGGKLVRLAGVQD